MLPILLSLGPIKIYSYGVFLALAFFVATFIIWKFSREEELEEEKILDGVLIGVFSGFLGARIFYIFLNLEDFIPNVIRMIHIFKFPGLVFSGGLISGTAALFFYFFKNKISFWKAGDIFVLGLILGQAISSIGCFLNGCFYGVKTNLFWGVYFPGVLGRRHPLQIYEFFFTSLIFFLLFKLYKKILSFKEEKRGLVLICYFFLFNFERFLLEFLREDSVYWQEKKISQLLSGLIALVSLIIFIFRYKREIKKTIEELFLTIKEKYKRKVLKGEKVNLN